MPLMPIFSSPGVWSGAAALVIGLLQASGHAPAAAIIADPHTAEAANTVVTSIFGILAGFLPAPGHKAG